MLVAAGGVACDKCNMVAVSLLESSLWLSSVLRLCESLKRSRRNSIVIGCEVDFDLISWRLIDSTSHFVNTTNGKPK